MPFALPLGAFAAAALVLVPLPWHWRARNIPTLSIIAWLFISNMILGINAALWAGSIDNLAPIWCDIATKLHIGATMTLPACCLCLCIHLERIASVRQVRTTAEQKRRRMFFDIAMCWGLPIITMTLHYIVQGHRFDIVEDIGCLPTMYISVAAICLIYVPILIVILFTLIFASAALYHFFRRRLTFARHLQDHATTSALTPSRYFRLMAMALVQMLWATGVTVANMVFTVTGGLRPWISWENVHSDFGRIALFPRAFLPASTWTSILFTFWAVPATSVLFFAFFAFGHDAVKEYKACFGVLRRVVRIPEKEKKERVPSVPVFMPHFPQLDAKDTARSSTSKTPAGFTDDIALTPHSASSSFSATTVPALKYDAGVQTGDGGYAVHKILTPSSASSSSSYSHYSPAAHDMA